MNTGEKNNMIKILMVLSLVITAPIATVAWLVNAIIYILFRWIPIIGKYVSAPFQTIALLLEFPFIMTLEKLGWRKKNIKDIKVYFENAAETLYNYCHSSFIESSSITLLAKDIKDGFEKSKSFYNGLIKPLNDFMINNPTYKERLQNFTIELNKRSLSLPFAIELYVSMQNSTIRENFIENNYCIYNVFDEENPMELDFLLEKNSKATNNNLIKALTKIESNFNDLDYEFIETIQLTCKNALTAYDKKRELVVGSGVFREVYHNFYPMITFPIEFIEDNNWDGILYTMTDYYNQLKSGNRILDPIKSVSFFVEKVAIYCAISQELQNFRKVFYIKIDGSSLAERLDKNITNNIELILSVLSNRYEYPKTYKE